MGKTLSPLRYPGGKSQTISKVKKIIETNNWKTRLYVEPFAGGFGVGLSLLANNVVDNAVINDYDLHIYHFWVSVLQHADELIELVQATPVSLQERETQKAIYLNPESTALQDGFATLYLNRVNYSGVLFAGPIGGRGQKSEYKVGCRFNKENIVHRIREVQKMRDRIQLFNLDASDLIGRELLNLNERCFYNIDPPYVVKGKSLYSVYYTEQDHRTFRNTVRQYLTEVPWIMTYDNCELIRELYNDCTIQEFELFHSAHNRAKGNELVITNIAAADFEW